jgi:protein CMS1
MIFNLAACYLTLLTMIGALKTTHVARLVIDGSHRDQKKRSIFDMKEMFDPMLQLLSRPEFKGRYNSKKLTALQILVF